MKHINNNPPEWCEHYVGPVYLDGGCAVMVPCGKPAKYERLFTDPKAKPMRLCGIHARQAKRRGYVVKPIGE